MVAVLFARSDSIYKTIDGLDVYDIERDARKYAGHLPVIAHPPCRAWGSLRAFAKPRHDEKELAFFAIEQVRKNGGVLEHPARSTLWAAANLPLPGHIDEFGGFTLPISQFWFGHRAMKNTWLYIVGVRPPELPNLPFALGESSHVICQNRARKNGRIKKGDRAYRPEVSEKEREHTPIALAIWLHDLCKVIGANRAA